MRIVRIFFAFLAAIATGIQAWLIFKKGEAICFNDGCNIVESLTTVPPLFFYLFATIFFLLLFFFSAIEIEKRYDRKRGKVNALTYCIHIMLTAAFAAEGVLIFFQYAIANTFCSVCLIVFSVIVLLNIASGIGQFIRGLVVFASVLMACFALQFSSSSSGQSLQAGTMATYHEQGNKEKVLLIFSEGCSHCEEVVDFLKEESFCDIYFNPYEKITEPFNFDGATIHQEYNPAATKSFMKSLGLTSFPLLITENSNGDKQILQGTSTIKQYLQAHCRLPEKQEPAPALLPKSSVDNFSTANGKSVMSQKSGFIVPSRSSSQDRCSEDSPCP